MWSAGRGRAAVNGPRAPTMTRAPPRRKRQRPPPAGGNGRAPHRPSLMTPSRRCQQRASPGPPRPPQRRTRAPPMLRQRRLRLSHPHPARLQCQAPLRRCQRRASPGQPRLPQQRRTRLRPAIPHGYRPPARDRPPPAVRRPPRQPAARQAARPVSPQPPHHRRARRPIRQRRPQQGHLRPPRLPDQARTSHGRSRPARAPLRPAPRVIRRRTRRRPATRRMYPPIRPGGLCPPPPERARLCLGPRPMRWQRPTCCPRSRLRTGLRRRAPSWQPTCPRRLRTNRRTPGGSSLRCRARCPTSSLPPAACGCCRPRAVARALRPVRLARHPRPGSARQPPARRRPRRRYRAEPRPGRRPPPLLRLPILPRLPPPQPLRRAPRAARSARRRRPLPRPW